MSIEKRNQKRMPKNFLVYIENGSFDLLGVSANISRNGLFVESPNPLSDGSEVLLTMAIENDLFEIKGEVCWAKRADDKFLPHVPTGMGIRILEAPDKYLNYVEELKYKPSVPVSPIRSE